MEKVYAGIREKGGCHIQAVSYMRPLGLLIFTQVEDYNFGTLMRNNAQAEYTETTTIFGETPWCWRVV